MLHCDIGDCSRDPRSDAYSAAQVLLNKQQIWCGGAVPDITIKPADLTTGKIGYGSS